MDYDYPPPPPEPPELHPRLQRRFLHDLQEGLPVWEAAERIGKTSREIWIELGRRGTFYKRFLAARRSCADRYLSEQEEYLESLKKPVQLDDVLDRAASLTGEQMAAIINARMRERDGQIKVAALALKHAEWLASKLNAGVYGLIEAGMLGDNTVDNADFILKVRR